MSAVTRRRLITAGLATIAGASGLAAAARIAARYGLVPPDHAGLYGVGATLTYGAQRLLTASQSLAREFDRSQLSAIAPVNGGPPRDEEYRRLRAGGFAEWRLEVDGLVARPATLSLAEIRALPRRSQITMQACEEGWSFIAEWTGVTLADVLAHVGVDTRARFVVFYPFDDYWDSLDLADAYHPQTLLAYGMNGADLSDGHGAPLRLRVARQLGYKSIKYLARISVVDSLKDIGQGLGSNSPDVGYSWYAGI